MVARRAHNPKVTGSNPVPATNWSRGVAVNMRPVTQENRRFDPGRDRHIVFENTKRRCFVFFVCLFLDEYC